MQYFYLMLKNNFESKLDKYLPNKIYAIFKKKKQKT